MNYFVLALVLLDSFALCQEQFTPEASDWSTFQDKAMAGNTDHSPDGISWIDQDDWVDWDGTVYIPTEHSKSELAGLICTGNTIRGLRTLFYQHNPFADVTNPTKAEVDEWHRLSLNHVRAMVGYSAPEYQIQPDKCLHLRALWSRQRQHTRMWDATHPGTCDGSTNPHCGASLIPTVAEQQPYLPNGISSCGATAGSEGMFNSAKSNIPWSIKWIRPFCYTLGAEGFWGGHTGPWFHRSLFGWDWHDAEPDNPQSNAGLRAKWSGTPGASLYVNPDITSGRFLVESAPPRFPGYECEGIIWGEGEDDATTCYERMLTDDNCGKRFMTYNSANGGCACYAPDMAICEPKMVSGRSTWDFESSVSSFDGFVLSDTMLHNGKRCQDIVWLTKAGDATHCLQKVIASRRDDPDPKRCGTKFITFNANGGGCACYAPEQTTCGTTSRESGRQTYELQMDPSYDPAAPAPYTVDNLDSEIDDSASKACVSPGKAYIMVVAPVLLLASKLW